MSNEFKTLSQGANDPRVPYNKLSLWNAIKSGNLKANRPIGAKKWIIKWTDLEAYLNGQG